MTPLVLLAAAAAAPVDHPRTFLLSLTGIPVRDPDSIKGFALTTWGVRFAAVCRIPSGWSIKAGGSLAPDGILEGEGGQGVTWYREPSPRQLRDIVLVTLYAPVQRRDIVSDGGRSVVPATFKGHATLSTDDADRRVRLTWRNVRLTPARSCPAA